MRTLSLDSKNLASLVLQGLQASVRDPVIQLMAVIAISVGVSAIFFPHNAVAADSLTNGDIPFLTPDDMVMDGDFTTGPRSDELIPFSEAMLLLCDPGAACKTRVAHVIPCFAEDDVCAESMDKSHLETFLFENQDAGGFYFLKEDTREYAMEILRQELNKLRPPAPYVEDLSIVVAATD